MEPIWALGFMSGTSLDGIDAAFLLSDGQKISKKGPTFFKPYPEEIRTQVKKVFGQPHRTEDVLKVEEIVTNAHITFAKEILEQAPMTPSLIGFHGQTIFHAPPLTLQIGNGQEFAHAIGIPVIYDFRTNDCNNGGQGAPLVPIYHQALCLDERKPIAVVNIGGVANITYLDGSEILIGFDTGPGNALIDDHILQHYGMAYDKGGEIAATGTSDPFMIEKWLQHPFFEKPFPKALDRDEFKNLTSPISKKSPSEAVATLTYFTAKAIAHACYQLPSLPQKLIVCGGGAKNLTLLKALKEILPETMVLAAESLGWNGDFIEAEAFAFLAIRSFYGLPLSFPLTTGVKIPLTGGKIAISEATRFF